MDEIIYLEPDEEITSVIDKIHSAKSASLGLVVPRGATILQSVVNLRLLLREAGSLGKQISIVTTDRIGQNLAAQVGLQVYNSVKEQKPTYMPPPPEHDTQEVIEIEPAKPKDEHLPNLKVHHFQDNRPVIHWAPQQKPVMKKVDQAEKVASKIEREKVEKTIDPRIKKIMWPMAGVLILLILVAGYLLYPKSTVSVFMTSEDLDQTVVLTVSDKITSPNIEQNVFPGEKVEAYAEKTEKFTTTGKKNLGGKATGKIKFVNGLDSNSHKFAAGTKLLSSSKTFILTGSVTVPGATVQNLQVVPGIVEAQVEAENAGEEYNIKAGKFVISGLPSAQQNVLYAEAKQDLAGGFTREVRVVSQEDYDKAKEKLLQVLDQEVSADLTKKAQNKKILEKAIVKAEPEIICSSGVDQEANDFEMKVRLQEEVIAFDFTDFNAFLTQILEKEVPSDKMVAIPSEEAFGLVVDKTAYDVNELNLTANVQAKISSRIDAEKIKTAILGKSKNAVTNYIKTQEGVADLEFEFRPAWIQRVSSLNHNVNVEIRYKSEEDE